MLLEFDIEYPRGSRRLGSGWDVMLMHHRGGRLGAFCILKDIASGSSEYVLYITSVFIIDKLLAW